MPKKTDFGFIRVSAQEKAQRVKQVFSSVAAKYDLMNDLMSLGIHRLWKRTFVSLVQTKSGDRIADLASGSGDTALLLAKAMPNYGELIVSDINPAMLKLAKDRFINAGIVRNIQFIEADAEHLNFPANYFDCVLLSFGLRNMTDKARALGSIHRKLVSGGQLLILEFSHPHSQQFTKLYDAYLFHIIPRLGKLVAQNEASYRYLAESIKMHPSQEQLKAMMQQAGFINCHYHNLSLGIVAVHIGIKP